MNVVQEGDDAALAVERSAVAAAIAAIMRELQGEDPIVGTGDRAELRRGWDASAYYWMAAER